MLTVPPWWCHCLLPRPPRKWHVRVRRTPPANPNPNPIPNPNPNPNPNPITLSQECLDAYALSAYASAHAMLGYARKGGRPAKGAGRGRKPGRSRDAAWAVCACSAVCCRMCPVQEALAIFSKYIYHKLHQMRPRKRLKPQTQLTPGAPPPPCGRWSCKRGFGIRRGRGGQRYTG